MDIKDKHVIVTGANRGIGEAIVKGLLEQEVAGIYATARKVESLPDFGDQRVKPLPLDITDRTQALNLPKHTPDANILINNAGVADFHGFLGGSEEMIYRDMEVNYFGTIRIIRTMAPVIQEHGQGAIVNILSIVALASIAGIGGYSASKAALHSATQAFRHELSPKGILVMGVYPGPIDTDMAAGMEAEKAPPSAVATAVINGIKAQKEDIFPDPMSAQFGEMYMRSPKELEKQFASF